MFAEATFYNAACKHFSVDASTQKQNLMLSLLTKTGLQRGRWMKVGPQESSWDCSWKQSMGVISLRAMKRTADWHWVRKVRKLLINNHINDCLSCVDGDTPATNVFLVSSWTCKWWMGSLTVIVYCVSSLTAALDTKMYMWVAKMISVCVVHGGVGPHFFSDRLYQQICGLPTAPVRVEDVSDHTLREQLMKVSININGVFILLFTLKLLGWTCICWIIDLFLIHSDTRSSNNWGGKYCHWRSSR